MTKKEKETDGSESRAVSLTTKVLKETAKNYDAAKQKVGDAAMAVASIMQAFQNNGGNNQAFKLARKLAQMEDLKAQTFIRDFHQYLTDFGVYQQLDMLDEVPDFKGAAKSKPSPSANAPASAAAH